MKRLAILAGILWLASCESEKNYLIAKHEVIGNQVFAIVRIYDKPYASPENQMIIAASIKELASQIKSKNLPLPEAVDQLVVRINSYDSLQFAKVGDASHYKWQANYGIAIKDLSNLSVANNKLDYLNQAKIVMFGKPKDADTSAMAFCSNAENRKKTPDFCNAVDNPEPRFKYKSRDGKYYLYGSEISEDDKKKGVGAAKTYAYEYLGLKDGVHKLRMENDTAYSECEEDCKSIKYIWNGKILDRRDYDPTSVIGAAFYDAMHGELEIYKAPPKK